MVFSFTKKSFRNVCNDSDWTYFKNFFDAKEINYIAIKHPSQEHHAEDHWHYMYQPENPDQFKKNYGRSFKTFYAEEDVTDILRRKKNNEVVAGIIGLYQQKLEYDKHDYIKVDSNCPDLLKMFHNIESKSADEAKQEQTMKKYEHAKQMCILETDLILQKVIRYNIYHETLAVQHFSAGERAFRGFKEKLRCSIEDYNCKINLFETQNQRFQSDGFTYLDLLAHNFFFFNTNYPNDVLLFKNGREEEIKDYIEQGIEFFKYIMDTQEINAVDFLHKVVVIMDCNDQKRNAQVLSGTSNGGKSTLANMIVELVQFGRVVNHGSASEFWLMDILNKRVIHLEECSLCPQNVEEAKELFEGSRNMKIAIKGKAPMALAYRIPVVASSNYLPWSKYCNSEHVPFSNRSYIFKFKNALSEDKIKDIIDKYKFTNGNKIFLSPLHLYIAYYHIIMKRPLCELQAILTEYARQTPRASVPKVDKLDLEREVVTYNDVYQAPVEMEIVDPVSDPSDIFHHLNTNYGTKRSISETDYSGTIGDNRATSRNSPPNTKYRKSQSPDSGPSYSDHEEVSILWYFIAI